MTDMELAKICAKTQCHLCKPDVKQECVRNRCWSDPNIRYRECPAVFYGVIKTQAEEKQKPEQNSP